MGRARRREKHSRHFSVDPLTDACRSYTTEKIQISRHLKIVPGEIIERKPRKSFTIISCIFGYGIFHERVSLLFHSRSTDVSRRAFKNCLRVKFYRASQACERYLCFICTRVVSRISHRDIDFIIQNLHPDLWTFPVAFSRLWRIPEQFSRVLSICSSSFPFNFAKKVL